MKKLSLVTIVKFRNTRTRKDEEVTIKEMIDKDYVEFERWQNYNFLDLDTETTLYLCKVRNIHIHKRVRCLPMNRDAVIKFIDSLLVAMEQQIKEYSSKIKVN